MLGCFFLLAKTDFMHEHTYTALLGLQCVYFAHPNSLTPYFLQRTLTHRSHRYTLLPQYAAFAAALAPLLARRGAVLPLAVLLLGAADEDVEAQMHALIDGRAAHERAVFPLAALLGAVAVVEDAKAVALALTVAALKRAPVGKRVVPLAVPAALVPKPPSARMMPNDSARCQQCPSLAQSR